MEKLESDLETFVRLCHLHEKVKKLEQALAEKDKEISSLRAAYRQELGRYKDDIHKLIVQQATDSAAYQQLIEKAVRFAENVVRNGRWQEHEWNEAVKFLQSPEVQVWKERT